MAAKLQAAQERIFRARRYLDELKNHLLEERGFFSEPFDRRFIIDVLGMFTPESAAPMRPLLDKALDPVLPQLRVDAFGALLTGMAGARLPHEPLWRAAGDVAMSRCDGATGAQVAGMAWAFATAGEQRPELFGAMRQAMASKMGDLSDDERRTFAWACAQVGEHCTELVGEPSERASPEAAGAIWDRMQLLMDTASSNVGLVSAEPVPIITMKGVVSPEQRAELLQLADDADIWRPSSRRGARSARGVDARRTSWSASLSSPEHRRHPTVISIRHWAAETLAVPESHVEALQLVRYFQGEEYGPHVDWGQSQDPSLWIGGQRTATALIYLSTLPDGCGGETVFPKLETKVRPEAGTAVLWPNVDRLGSPEPLVEHFAAPVLCSTPKYAINVWIRGQPQPKYAGD